jgi:hypothetical protein
VVRPEDSSLPPREAFSRLTLDHRHNLWGVHLTVVLKKHPVIWRKLINDGIILPTRAAELESCVLKRIGQGRRWSRVLDSITDPFILGLGNPEPRMLVLHHGGIFQGKLYLISGRPLRARTISGQYKPTTLSHPLAPILNTDVPGKALVRFEMANFPREPGASESIPKVVLRVLEITEPPKAEDAQIASQIFSEGQLLHKYDFLKKKVIRPWSTTWKSEDRFITPTSRKLLEETYLGAKKPGAET